MKDKLLPCPCCGETDISYEFHKEVKHTVYCNNFDCRLWNSDHDTKEKAIKAWNTRS